MCTPVLLLGGSCRQTLKMGLFVTTIGNFNPHFMMRFFDDEKSLTSWDQK